MLKKILLVVLITILFIIVLLSIYNFNITRKIENYQSSFAKVTRGMKKKIVISIMNEEPHYIFYGNKHHVLWWNNQKIVHINDKVTISETFVYDVSTFFLHISFEISFDTNGNVVGKHRFD